MNPRRLLNLNYIVLVTSILALIGWGIGVAQWRGYVECQAKVNDTVIQVLELRSQGDDSEREKQVQTSRAFRNAMNTLLAQPPKTSKERLDALVALQHALDEQEQQRELNDQLRKDHPIPELPSQSCR